MTTFAKDIQTFNEMYRLPVSRTPSLTAIGMPVAQRLRDFKAILAEELDEIDEIIAKVEGSEVVPNVQILTDLADLLGDLQVFCASEMAKFGLPLNAVLEAIMQSNFSKMGADGKPSYDERGKLMKGPNYWKPEPAIEALLTAMMPAEPSALAPCSAPACSE